MKIYLSPSNQPGNKYVVGNTNEKVQMEAVAAKVKALLDRDYSCETVMATLSMGIGSSERPQEAKNKGCDFYLAIHSNAAGGTPPCTAAGAVGFYHPDSAKSKALMIAMVNELNAICPVKSNRASQVASGMTQFNGQGYGEIRSPMQKGVGSALIEVNFHDNLATAQWIIDNKDAIAGAIVKAIVSTFGIAKKNAPTTPPSDPAPDVYYRVRKTWGDAKSQKGAYKILNNAKKCADDNPGYSVFDPKGALVYTGKNTAAPAPEPSGVIENGSLVAFKGGTKNYYPGGSAVPSWVIADYNHLVTQTTSGGKPVVKGGKVCVLLGKKIHKKTGKEEAGINTWTDKDALEVVGGASVPGFTAYMVKVTADSLNIRTGPGTDAAIVGAITDKGIYTIVDEANGPDATRWGKLKSGAGWISLDYTHKR